MRRYASVQKTEDFKIVIHDDEKGIIEGLKVFLKRQGINNVRGVIQSKCLLEILEKENFDLLILDYILDNIRADTLIPEIRKVAPEMSIILLTGHHDCYERPIDTITKFELEGFVEKSDDYTAIMMNILSVKHKCSKNKKVEGSFGYKLSWSRKDAKRTQDQVAEAIGVTRETISKYERDIVTPDINVVAKISRYLNLDLNWLLGHYSIKKLSKDRENAVDNLS